MTSRRGSRERLIRNLILLALVAVLGIWTFLQQGGDASDSGTGASSRNAVASVSPSAAPDDAVLQPQSSAAAGSSGDVSGLQRLTDTQHFNRNALTHIFAGEINRSGNAVGYHSQAFENTPGAVVAGTETAPDVNGVYTAQVTVDGKAKAGNRGYSTFYPTSMSAQQVVDAINQAYDSRRSQGDTFVGQGGGLTIQLVLDDSGRIITAYPLQR